jgi:hypothetical protein
MIESASSSKYAAQGGANGGPNAAHDDGAAQAQTPAHAAKRDDSRYAPSTPRWHSEFWSGE